jgi:hypothetical protein
MRTAALFALLCAMQLAARADFSYTSTRKTTGGAMAAMAGGAGNATVTKIYYKGQKMRTESGDTAVQIDFDAQTVTTVNNARKTIAVRSFSDIGAVTSQASPGATIDAKETGQRKNINGFDAKELVLTMDVDMSQMAQGRGLAGRGMGGAMRMEIDMWIASDVPGGAEMRSFYQKNAARFPWNAAGGENAGLQSAMAEVQKKIASMDGVTVEQVIRMKPVGAAGGGAQMPAMPQMTPEQSAQMDQARARLEAMKAQGGPQAEMAAQALARMGGMGVGQAAPASASGAGSLIEMTIDSTGFSTAAISDSVFAIPAGYQKTDR